MTCEKPPNSLLLCNIDPTKIKNSFINVIYTDLLLNQFSVHKDFKRLVQEIGISTPQQYNFLIISDDISSYILKKKLPVSDNLYIVNAQTLQNLFEGNRISSTGKKKIVKRQNVDAFRLTEIYTFKQKYAQTIILLVNVYKTFYIERLLKDNDKSRIKNIYVILNSLIEFPLIYTLEVPFKILLCNDISENKNINCNYVNVSNHANRVIVLSNYNNRSEDSIVIDSSDMINNIPVNIDPEKIYILNFFNKEHSLLNNIRSYRIFKIFYYTYCFNDAKWSIHPNNKETETLYIFQHYFKEEISICSKWWPNNETISVMVEKLRNWCPHIFGEITNWFFQCDIHKIFSTASSSSINAKIQLQHINSRPICAGGQIWQVATLAYMCLSIIGIGTTRILHLDILKDNGNKMELTGYYKHLFNVEYDTSF